MATVTPQPIGKLHDRILVKITKDDYLPSFETALKKYSKTANVPGFRKGNVPAGMVKKMYGQSAFVDEVLRTANRELETYLKTEKPAIFAQPLAMEYGSLVLDMNQPADFDFAFEIGLKPEFDVDLASKKGKITKYTIAVTDEMVDAEIDNISRRAGKVENPEAFANDTDIVYATYQACDKLGNITEGTEPTEDVVTLEQMPKTLGEQLRTKKPGDSILFKPSEVCTAEELPVFMKSALRKEATDMEAADSNYQLTLTKIGVLVPRELNEEFFAEAFPGAEIKDTATFKARIKVEIEKQLAQVSNERLQNDIFETLVHETPIELPEAFLKAWLQRGGEKQKTDEEVANEYPTMDHQIRWTLISDKLITDNEIKVSYEEVIADIKTKVMAYFGMKNEDDAPWMETYLEKMTKEEKTMDETYRNLLFGKLFAKLEKDIDVAEKQVTQEEFAAIQPAHHHHH